MFDFNSITKYAFILNINIYFNNKMQRTIFVNFFVLVHHASYASIPTELLLKVRFLGACQNLWEATITFIMSARLSVSPSLWNNSAPVGRNSICNTVIWTKVHNQVHNILQLERILKWLTQLKTWHILSTHVLRIIPYFGIFQINNGYTSFTSENIPLYYRLI